MATSTTTYLTNPTVTLNPATGGSIFDLTPLLVARFADAVVNVVAIKEFSCVVRRVWQLHH